MEVINFGCIRRKKKKTLLPLLNSEMSYLGHAGIILDEHGIYYFQRKRKKNAILTLKKANRFD